MNLTVFELFPYLFGPKQNKTKGVVQIEYKLRKTD